MAQRPLVLRMRMLPARRFGCGCGPSEAIRLGRVRWFWLLIPHQVIIGLSPLASSMPKESIKTATRAASGMKRRPRMIILAGFVGSGKTTLAMALCWYYPSYTYISQDVLGSREATKRRAESALENGESIIIDCQNMRGADRQPYAIVFARKYKVILNLIRFDTPMEECTRRALDRAVTPGGHPTLKTIKSAQRALYNSNPRTYDLHTNERWNCEIIIRCPTIQQVYWDSPQAVVMKPQFPWTKEGIVEIMETLRKNDPKKKSSNLP